MRKQLQTTIVLSTLLSFTTAAFAAPNPPSGQAAQSQQRRPQASKHVDLVIAIDTSSSMDGLIDSARGKLWDVVNLLGQAKPQPILRVGLISYGNTAHNPQAGWVKKELDLTSDLDKVYAKLFELRTSGGEEYVARAVTVATNDMSWSQDQSALKIVFVAGNESAQQDPKISVETAISGAREKGILVNTIYCGNARNTEAGGWAQVAALGHGKYASIDHNNIVAVNTPFDAELGKLNGQLNGTYIAYGSRGGEGLAMQAAQDKNAAAASAPAAASRVAAKSSGLYSNESWDLVDAKKKGKSVKDLRAEELPVEMKPMTTVEREKFVEEKSRERAQIQQKIAEISRKRDEYIKTERSKTGGPANLDDAMKSAVKPAAEAAGFAF